LVRRCWNGRVVGRGAINRAISEVRRLGTTYGAFTLETIPRVGYRLLAHDAQGDLATGPGQLAPQAGSRWRAPTVQSWAFICIAAVLLVVGWAVLFRSHAPSIRDVSVAVLPFADHSERSDQAHLASGMTVEVTHRLRDINRMKVYGGDWMPGVLAEAGGNLEVLGQRLSVDHILSGDVRLDGDKAAPTGRSQMIGEVNLELIRGA
jgi:hypothetical protein